MAHKPSRHQSAPKAAARTNPIVLGAKAASWMFWTLAAAITALIFAAIFWLLTHPLTT
jgi:hypothetical protein